MSGQSIMLSFQNILSGLKYFDRGSFFDIKAGLYFLLEMAKRYTVGLNILCSAKKDLQLLNFHIKYLLDAEPTGNYILYFKYYKGFTSDSQIKYKIAESIKRFRLSKYPLLLSKISLYLLFVSTFRLDGKVSSVSCSIW